MSTFRKIINFKEIPHKADAAIIAYGQTLPELFSNASLGMYHIMGIIGKDFPKNLNTFTIQDSDNESLLVSFLTELLFLAEKGFKTKILKLRIKNIKLKTRLIETPIINIANEIKAVTFNEMIIANLNGIYQTKIIFDL